MWKPQHFWVADRDGNAPYEVDQHGNVETTSGSAKKYVEACIYHTLFTDTQAGMNELARITRDPGLCGYALRITKCDGVAGIWTIHRTLWKWHGNRIASILGSDVVQVVRVEGVLGWGKHARVSWQTQVISKKEARQMLMEHPCWDRRRAPKGIKFDVG